MIKVGIKLNSDLYPTGHSCCIWRAFHIRYILAIFLAFSILLAFTGLQRVYAVQLFSKNEKPFGVSYDDWLAKFVNWDKGMSTDQFTPKQNGCIINNSSSMAMLVETTVEGSPYMVCSISSKQGILVPLWIAFCNCSIPKLLTLRLMFVFAIQSA